jgi:anti-sigma regulatory factor (Ser/Thr protein kinase)
MPKGITEKTRIIRGFLLDAIRLRKQDVVADASKAFGISRQSINRHLSTLVEEGWLTASGNTRARVYSLGPKRFLSSMYSLEGLDEHLVYRNDFAFIFEGLPDSVIEICHYGFTEMLNNARDHSEGEYVTVTAIRDGENVSIIVSDDGEGIFKRIARIMKLSDPRESILELSKGKLTTDPENHTGEGIFFTSRAFDYYHINSGDLCFTHHDNVSNDVLLHNKTVENGTTVHMEIALNSTKDLGQIFDEYSSGPDEYRFERTIVPVRLALYEGESLVSRSQAKRILHRVEKFRTVILDFEDVDKIGQAFADEVFRVFLNNHPDINLISINTTKMIDRMITRAQSNNQ